MTEMIHRMKFRLICTSEVDHWTWGGASGWGEGDLNIVNLSISSSPGERYRHM